MLCSPKKGLLQNCQTMYKHMAKLLILYNKEFQHYLNSYCSKNKHSNHYKIRNNTKMNQRSLCRDQLSC
jgi:hypothetical protein